MRAGCAADHSPPSSAEVMEELCYTSTHPLGHNRACSGVIYLYIFYPVYGRVVKYLNYIISLVSLKFIVSYIWVCHISLPCLQIFKFAGL